MHLPKHRFTTVFRRYHNVILNAVGAIAPHGEVGIYGRIRYRYCALHGLIKNIYTMMMYFRKLLFLCPCIFFGFPLLCCQVHANSGLGWDAILETWGADDTRFTNGHLFDYGKLVAMKGGVVTIGVGMNGIMKTSPTDHGIWIHGNIGRNELGQWGRFASSSREFRSLPTELIRTQNENFDYW